MTGLIVHEWISKHGGSENVAEAMADTFPDADILCLWNDAPERFAGHRVTESWLARTPLRKSKVAALPFMPATWANVDVSDHDFVLVSSHLFAHHVGGRLPADAPPKYVYVHTPARYIWAPELDARGQSPLAKLASPFLRTLDASRTGGGTHYAANSEFVRDRIREVWGQEARVIYPPVDVARLQSVASWRSVLTVGDEAVIAALPSDFLLGASRFVPYKRLDVVIRAGEVAGLPVVLAGSGALKAELQVIAESAKVSVTFVDRPSDELLYALYQAALAFVFPAIEDFGIMPVEAMSLGTPVLVSPIGGAAESVRALAGGVTLESFSAADLKDGIQEAISLDMTGARSRALSALGVDSFSSNLRTWTSTPRHFEDV